MIIDRKKNWKNVKKVKHSSNLYEIYLDDVRLKSDKGNDLKLPEYLADEIVLEWSDDKSVNAIKKSFFTKFSFSVADFNENEHKSVIEGLLEYGNCDPICYIADKPRKLHVKQKKLYKPTIKWIEKFLSVKLNIGEGLLFVEQPLLNSHKIKKYLTDLNNFQLVAIHELTKSIGSLFITLAIYEKSITPKMAWEVANVEDNHRIEVWGEVEEETHIKNVNLEHFNRLVGILKMI